MDHIILLWPGYRLVLSVLARLWIESRIMTQPVTTDFWRLVHGDGRLVALPISLFGLLSVLGLLWVALLGLH